MNMKLNINQLSERRKSWVEANRQNGFEDGIKRLLTDLYPDNAHFIYELLQNAEDAGATVVRFILNENNVEFEHNGSRLFSIEDVDSITSIGVSNKRDDPTSIGKFGVGFKAVFAYTLTPQIKSGDFHFCIRDLVVPVTDGLIPCNRDRNDTFMTFPFDNPKMPTEKALANIEKHLRQLNENTLLFLRNIKRIEYLLPDLGLGFLERRETEDNRLEISVQHPNELAPSTLHYLRFQKQTEIRDEDGSSKSCSIAIAFALEKAEELGSEKSLKRSELQNTTEWRIRPLNPGQVFIYFPTEKETSNLRFHMHAPFASTVARDSVRDCPANIELRDQLVGLVAESMLAIRDQGLLTVRFLATLPNDKDSLPVFYKPFIDGLVETFKDEALTPMRNGEHAPASDIFRGSAQLANLVTDEDFVALLGESYTPPMWVANPPQRNQREDTFLNMLEISEWTAEDLVRALCDKPNTLELFLASKTDLWHQQLYVLLADYLSDAPSVPYLEAQNRKRSLATLRIVRRSDGKYGSGSECYFPSEGVDQDDLMPRVAKGVYTSGRSEDQQAKAKDFLLKIGVREAGEAEQVEAILKSRYSDDADETGSFAPKIEDIKRFVTLVEREPFQANLFSEYSMFQLKDGDWGRPQSVYLDTPFGDTGLSALYDLLGEKADRWALSPDYKKCGVAVDRIVDFARRAGAQNKLNVISLEQYYSQDYTINHLDLALQAKDSSISKLIWKTLVELESGYVIEQYAHRLVRKRVNFYYDGDSELISRLKHSEWVPQAMAKELSFVRPTDADPKLLPGGYSFDKGWKWVAAVDFGCSVRQREEAARLQSQSKNEAIQQLNEVAHKLGFDSVSEAREMAELKRLDPSGYKRWLERNKQKPTFPTRNPADPERRSGKLTEQLDEAPTREFQKRQRSVRTTRGAINPVPSLRSLYTNQDDQMICQLCKEEMPFRKRSGEHYFEAVEVLSQELLPKEHEAQYLALCPLCAAMYKEFVRHDEVVMSALKQAILESEDPEIKLQLGEVETTLQFVETHFFDLKTILGADSP